jgi:hypothetical protein
MIDQLWHLALKPLYGKRLAVLMLESQRTARIGTATELDRKATDGEIIYFTSFIALWTGIPCLRCHSEHFRFPCNQFPGSHLQYDTSSARYPKEMKAMKKPKKVKKAKKAVKKEAAPAAPAEAPAAK